jgi:hypothetical protein
MDVRVLHGSNLLENNHALYAEYRFEDVKWNLPHLCESVNDSDLEDILLLTPSFESDMSGQHKR